MCRIVVVAHEVHNQGENKAKRRVATQAQNEARTRASFGGSSPPSVGGVGDQVVIERRSRRHVVTHEK